MLGKMSRRRRAHVIARLSSGAPAVWIEGSAPLRAAAARPVLRWVRRGRGDLPPGATSSVRIPGRALVRTATGKAAAGKVGCVFKIAGARLRPSKSPFVGGRALCLFDIPSHREDEELSKLDRDQGRSCSHPTFDRRNDQLRARRRKCCAGSIPPPPFSIGVSSERLRPEWLSALVATDLAALPVDAQPATAKVEVAKANCRKLSLPQTYQE